MKNNSVKQNDGFTKTVNMHQATAPRLSDDAFYLLALVCRLKKLLGPASLQYFLATGKSVVFSKKAS